MPRPKPVVIVRCIIVLCGGTSRRLGGVDKTRESLAGTTVLDHLLDDLPPGWPVICVGEMRATTRSVQWRRESPAGGGPVAGIAAGLEHLKQLGVAIDHDASPGNATAGNAICVVVGGDMPFAAAALPTMVDALNAQPGLDAVLASDPDGRTQPLLAAYRLEALRAALPGESGGARLMAVVDALLVGTVPCDSQTVLDVDTPEALEEARHIVGT
jgi:molybdopterin-guanine dinucleotide biosynthesis protein A